MLTKLFINGKWEEAASGRTFPTINPATTEVIAHVAEGDAADIDRAVKAAVAALEGPWGRMDAAQRGRILWKMGERILARADELARLETLDNGKTITESSRIDVPYAADLYFYYAGAATKLEGHTIPVNGPYFNYTLREPLGVVGLIVPWNFPLLLASRKVAAALAAGNTVVLKPAAQTPLTALVLAEIGMEAGLPPGVLNVVPGHGATAGAALVKHPQVDGIALTGGTATGQQLMRDAAATVKKLHLELGGKSPNIVFADADLEAAARMALLGIFYNKGEVCTAGSRLLVEKPIYDSFMAKLLERAQKLQPGDPLDPKSRLGPLVSEAQLANVKRYVEIGEREGARLICGGRPPEPAPGKGYFFQPTIFDNVAPNATIAQEEIFGPVLAAMPFHDGEELLKIANGTIYGLAAAIWTKDIKKAHRLARALKAGTVWINTYNNYDAAMPYGGYKASGFGRESGMEAFEFYSQSKSVWVDLS
ncbi:MAG: aldehyde dehydrogenase family protein [candidate division KSB1 bacterium]|nr:aldehyde dehydrogenase family protein [candidate division KSB1 bacterium]MDZ7274753.1 aldehyde dehydrogenase family protein [candidate division KSB1 bacterium]MDZ7285578.1 aldehyde dehydrogenase family protein [candidate division KSB1 bacterium]MDZ7298610.1 aldehyde dehydrogenase family protein [candidate division KSB1 bacterium]MDZ7349474.1 aldehyde dehydrogenase family protein [candidate division KSB1 bacterium]